LLKAKKRKITPEDLAGDFVMIFYVFLYLQIQQRGLRRERRKKESNQRKKEEREELQYIFLFSL